MAGLQSLYRTTWMKGMRRAGQKSSVLHGPPPSPAHRRMQKSQMVPSRYSILTVAHLTCNDVERWVFRNFVKFFLIRHQPSVLCHSQLSAPNEMEFALFTFDCFATIKYTGKHLCGQQVCLGPGDVCIQRAKPPYALQRRGEQSGKRTFNPL